MGEPSCLKHKSYFAGSGFTNGKCADCGVGILHPNTFTPKFCVNCSLKDKKCMYCGCDITKELQTNPPSNQ